MIYLILAIVCSTLISVIMRLSSTSVKHNLGMLSVNYLVCTFIAACFTGVTSLFPSDANLGKTMAMGALHGILYLASFILFQNNVKRNGVVLSSIFMKLGLLVPLVLSVFLFNEIPTVFQIAGFVISVGAIILINLKSDSTQNVSGLSLVILLLAGGAGDAMSKVYEEAGDSKLSTQFLFYTFLVALVLCLIIMLIKKQRIGKCELIFGALIGIPNFFSAKFLLASLDTVPAVVAYPTFSVATILAVTVAGIVLFREKLSKTQIFAIAAILVALVLLNI